jgi:hypothetical protein
LNWLKFHFLHSVDYNSNKRKHTILLKPYYYNTPVATCFGIHVFKLQ